MSLLLLFLFFVSVSANSVVIIGAGPSGIAAATKLLENNFTNLTILEAENRIGGRVNTVKFGEGLIELGAEYCHGEEGNIVKELVKDYNLLEPNLNYLSGEIYYSNGTKLDHQFVREMQNVILSEEISEETEGKSVGEVFMHR